MKCKMYLFVAIFENGHHLGFSIGESYRMDLITIEMSHAKFGDCFTICTIHPKNAYYLLRLATGTLRLADYLGRARSDWQLIIGDPSAN